MLNTPSRIPSHPVAWRRSAQRTAAPLSPRTLQGNTASSVQRSHPDPSDARTLYLGAEERKHISATAAALVICSTQTSPQRLPIGRVARIICSGAHTDWTGGALWLCQSHGIPIVWIDAQGQVCGHLHPNPSAQPSIATLASLWSTHPQGPQRYANWLQARRMAVLYDWAQDSKPTPQLWQQLKQSWVYRGEIHAQLPAHWLALCQAHALARTHSEGLPSELPGPRGETFNLAQDLGHLLWAQLNLSSATLAQAAQDPASATHLFESWLLTHGGLLLTHLHLLINLARTSLGE